MNTFDSLALADSLLAGNQASRLVLVDWLSDAGDFEEANFIRRASASRVGDLEIAVRQISAPHVVELGCEFLEQRAGEKEMRLYSLLGCVRNLLKYGGTPEQFAASSRAFAEFRSERGFWDDGLRFDLLNDAVHTFSTAVSASQQNDSPRAAAVAVTSTARLLRAPNFGEGQSKRQSSHLSWQIKRTRELLGQLARQNC